MSKRATRRHHYHRLKEKRIKQNYWGFGTWRNGFDDSQVGIAIDTPKPCSCYMCMNPRHNAWAPRKDRITRQELKAEFDLEEQLSEIQLQAWENEHIYDWAKYDYWPTSEDFHMNAWEEDSYDDWWWDDYDDTYELDFQEELESCYIEFYKQEGIDDATKEEQISDCWWQREDEWYEYRHKFMDEDDVWEAWENDLAA